MDESQKRQQIERYFKTFPKWTVWIIVIGALVMLGQSVGPVCIGAAMIALACWRLWAWSQKPEDGQLDQWITEDLARLKARALEKSNLDASELLREPVLVTGPKLRGLGGAQFAIRRGKDQVIRFTPIDATIINFMEHQLVLYQCTLDLTTGKPLNESVDEYFYKDVVSAATQSKSFTCELDKKALVYFPQAKKAIVNGKLQLNSAEHFVLTTSGGTSISMVLSDPTLAEGLGGGTIPTQLADQAVQAVRKMLREKKAS
jgi:hypothetical protein